MSAYLNEIRPSDHPAYTTANFLAKKDDLSGLAFDDLYTLGRDFHLGEAAALERLSDRFGKDISIHNLHLSDDEEGCLSAYPELEERYANGDRHQIAAASDVARNLDAFRASGISFAFIEDPETLDTTRDKITSPELPYSAQLIRERIVTVSGFDYARLLYLYHDVLDHMWLFSHIRDKGIEGRYADMFKDVGSPFDGFLLSRQSEMVSGIGFATRRYLSASDSLAAYAPDPKQIASALEGLGSDDLRVTSAAERFARDDVVARCAAFALKDATSQLAEERRRWGSVKVLGRDENGQSATEGVFSLFEPRYVAFVMDVITSLTDNLPEYEAEQSRVNAIIEGLVRQYLQTGEASGSLALTNSVITQHIPSETMDWMNENKGFSTSYKRQRQTV